MASAGGSGEPLAGVTMELRDADGTVVERAVTTADGAYSFLRVPGDATYTVAVPDPPSSYGVPPVQTFEVGPADSANHDFALSRPGSLAGLVADTSGDPVAGVTVRITGPDGFDETRETDAAGNYDASGLAPGTYTITVGDDTRTATITEAGENVGGLDFVLASVVDPTPTPTPTPPPSAAASGADSRSAVLPDTGGPSMWVPLIGFGLLCRRCRTRGGGASAPPDVTAATGAVLPL